jgi:hypothetical protein
MGSKPVREAHMMRYGSTLRQLGGDFEEAHVSRSRMEASCTRLSKPKRSATKFSYESKNKSDSGPSEQMDDLFPPHLDVEEVSTIPKEISYPEDWRRLPEEVGSGKLEWLYESLKLDIETPLQKSQSQLQYALTRGLKDLGADGLGSAANRKDVRSMVRDGARFGVLVDIVATRRNILTGVPHELADFVYKYLEAEYPITVRFVLVGITDNATKLVAKDIFDSRGGGRLKRLTFNDIDGDHLFVAYPRENAAQALRERGVKERERKELEHRLRTWTPKYTPPSEPSWMSGARIQVARTKEFLDSAESKCDHYSWRGHCARCWSHNSFVSEEPATQVNADGALKTLSKQRTQVSLEPEVPQQQVQAEPTQIHEAYYSPENCVPRLRELRRRHREEKGRVAVVKEPVELLKVVQKLGMRNQ